jgi:asparagine synthase (glutamine-hydrolysing)
MCGIAGIIGKHENAKQTLSKMLEIQKHRGPDATEIWCDDFVFLGHNRLAIIDLDENANQPMQSSCGRYIIVFNGEIYNYLELKKLVPEYTFKTKSDTEVLLALYQKIGKEMLNLLNGMFSFLIYDQHTKDIFIARDRFGVKPFYYAFKKEIFYFASEIKTLWKAGVTKINNKKVFANYITFGTYGLPNETFWQDIHQLPGGHYIQTNVNNIKVFPQKWYHFEENIKKIPLLNEDELKEQYLSLLIDAVKLRFRADVPVGFNCSGGLDSSLLLALVHKIFPNENTINAYTFYSNDARYDELPWVAKLIISTNYPLHKCLFDKNEIPKLIDKVSYFQDEPFGGFPTMAYSNLFKEARNQGNIVLLDGQGMDEAWAGYDYYHNKSGQIIQGTISSPVRPEVFENDFLKFAEKELYLQPFENNLQNLQYRDLFYTKIPRALRFNDRNSMMYSTELREPFLDYRLVELAFAQNEGMKFQNGQSKWMLRKIATELMGSEISLAPKRPLQTPQREWIANELLEYMEDKIHSFSKSEFVNSKKVLQIWNDYKLGNQENSFYLWQWINLNEINDR